VIFVVRSAVEDDLDLPDELTLSPEYNEQYLALIEKRIRSHKPKMLHPFVPGKKVLVLDVDYTLFEYAAQNS
jgi:predicted enzyme involved in methoxymalonyl-ACP biosynthesis